VLSAMFGPSDAIQHTSPIPRSLILKDGSTMTEKLEMNSRPTLSVSDEEYALGNTWLLRMSLRCIFMAQWLNFYSSVFINTAVLFWAFNINADPTAPIDDWAFTESANTHPQPFKVIFDSRVSSTMDGVKELMEDYGL